VLFGLASSAALRGRATGDRPNIIIHVFSSVNTTADNEVQVKGSVSGSYLDTWSDDGAAESITEVQSGGSPSNRTDSLEHKWLFNIPSGGTVTFHINAWISGSGDDGAFLFSYSTDDQTYIPWFSVNSRDPGNSQVEIGPGPGVVHLRVKDATQIPGNYALDTINIDEMHFTTQRTESVSPQVASSIEGGNIRLDWAPISFADHYLVYRGDDPYVLPATPLASVTDTFFLDSLNASAAAYYFVIAVDSQGSFSAPSSANAYFPYALLPGENQ